MYRSHFVAAGSGPRGWDISPSDPAAGSRSSSPGCHWRGKKGVMIRTFPFLRVEGNDAPSSQDILIEEFIKLTISQAVSFIPHHPIFCFICNFFFYSFHLFPSSLETHSSDSRSLVSLSLSLKQPRECILSKTSGSISSATASILMATFLGMGCSGSGSFFPALKHTQKMNQPDGT